MVAMEDVDVDCHLVEIYVMRCCMTSIKGVR